MTHPLVGVTTWRRRFETYTGNDPLHSLADHYVTAVVDSGMVPILFPAGQSTSKAGRLVAMVDGLVLSGGGDVDPAIYGALRNQATYGDDPVVDEFEIALVGRPVPRESRFWRFVAAFNS